MTDEGPKDLGRQVLTIQVRATLGDHADEFDIPAIVEKIIEVHGFVDVDQINSRQYWEEIVMPHDHSGTAKGVV